jgi:NitT/TauT family transport system substrate-binding protein
MLGVILLVQALTVVVAGPPESAQYLPVRVAAAEGYFTREGLGVTVRSVRGEIEAANVLIEGGADLAATSLEAMARRALGDTGSQVRVALGLTAAPAVALLASSTRPDPPRSLAALRGQPLGIATPGPDETWLGAILARARLAIGKVKIDSLGARELVRAVDLGAIAAGLIEEPAASDLLARGRATLLADLRTPGAAAETLGVSTLHAAVFARADRLPDRDTLSAFTRAVLAAEQRIAAGDAATLAPGLPPASRARPEEFAALIASARELYLPEGAVSVERLRSSLALIRARLALPALGRLPKPEDLIIRRPR